MGCMKLLLTVALSVTLALAAAAVAVRPSAHPTRGVAADRAFTCVSPIVVSVEGKPVAATPLICLPTP